MGNIKSDPVYDMLAYMQKINTQLIGRTPKKIVFKNHDLGIALDNLTREDFYDAPNVDMKSLKIRKKARI